MNEKGISSKKGHYIIYILVKAVILEKKGYKKGSNILFGK